MALSRTIHWRPRNYNQETFHGSNSSQRAEFSLTKAGQKGGKEGFGEGMGRAERKSDSFWVLPRGRAIGLSGGSGRGGLRP